MARQTNPPSPSPPPRPPLDSDPGPAFDPVEEWLVDFDDPIMSAELEAESLGPAEDAAVLQALDVTAACGDAGKASDDSAALNSCEFGSKEEPAAEDGSVGQAGNFCGQEIDRKAEMNSGRLDELLAPDQLLAVGIGDLSVKDDGSEGAVATETVPAAAAAPVDVEVDTASSVKEEGTRGKEAQESSKEESESSEEEDKSSDASSSSDEEEESKEDEESSEASSSSDDGELGAKKRGGDKGDSMEALLEEGELMVGSDEEEDVPKGHIKSKYEAEVLRRFILWCASSFDAGHVLFSYCSGELINHS
jgi:H/ACA ribonucleoprotein complex non-core subunit NAF1